MTRILIDPDGNLRTETAEDFELSDAEKSYIRSRAVSLSTPKDWSVPVCMMRDVTPTEGGSGAHV